MMLMDKIVYIDDWVDLVGLDDGADLIVDQADLTDDDGGILHDWADLIDD